MLPPSDGGNPPPAFLFELAALKYEADEACSMFFGGVGAFKRNWQRQARRKRLL